MARGDEEDQGTLGTARSEPGWELTMLLQFERHNKYRDQWRSMVSKVPDIYGTRD